MKKIKKNIKKSKYATKQEKKERVSKSTSFAEIIEKYPKASEILKEKGMHCFGCAMASTETLEQGAIMHGLNPDKLVKELNRKLNKIKVKDKS
jgi:hybrid cluster-associated redox disulfide protein